MIGAVNMLSNKERAISQIKQLRKAKLKKVRKLKPEQRSGYTTYKAGYPKGSK